MVSTTRGAGHSILFFGQAEHWDGGTSTFVLVKTDGAYAKLISIGPDTQLWLSPKWLLTVAVLAMGSE